VVGREFVQEDDRRSGSCFLEIETDMVAGDGVGHLKIPLVVPDFIGRGVNHSQRAPPQ
jgi:hypothetical protein